MTWDTPGKFLKNLFFKNAIKPKMVYHLGNDPSPYKGFIKNLSYSNIGYGVHEIFTNVTDLA